MTLTLRALDNTTDIVFIMGETEPPQIIPREKDPSMTVNLGKNIPCTTIPWVRIPHVMGHTIVSDLSADISGLCCMFADIANLSTKKRIK